MKRTALLVTFSLYALCSYAQDSRFKPATMQRLKNDGFFERQYRMDWQRFNKYALMDDLQQEHKHQWASYHYKEPEDKIYNMKTPDLKLYRFDKNRYSLPAEKKN
jgi:hypothetical protein